MNGTLYGLIDPRDLSLRYVGVTLNAPERRLRQHMTMGRTSGRLPVSNWIGKLVKLDLKPIMVILNRYAENQSDVYAAEVELIARFRDAGCPLLNLTPGGRGGGVGPKSAEHRAKIAAAHRGRKKPPRTPEWRANHAATMTGRKHSEQTRAKMSETQQRRRITVPTTCPCGAEFQVIPSRVGRIKYCSPKCSANYRGQKGAC